MSDEGRKRLESDVRLPFRLAIDGKIILEFKHFASGFDNGQLAEHLRMATSDIEKLACLGRICPEGRAIVLFDEKGYLTGKRRQPLIDKRNSRDQRLRIYQIKEDNSQGWKWDRM
jgi:hypothetical protein